MESKKQRRQRCEFVSLCPRTKARRIQSEVGHTMFRIEDSINTLNLEFSSASIETSLPESDDIYELSDIDCDLELNCGLSEDDEDATSSHRQISVISTEENDKINQVVDGMIPVDVVAKALHSFCLEAGIIGNDVNLLRDHMSAVGVPISERKSWLSLRRKIDLEEFSGGTFYYFGIKDMVRHAAKMHTGTSFNNRLLKINVDGIPLYKSSSTSFWCVLGSIKIVADTVFPIAIWCGKGKPNLAQFLDKFVIKLDDVLKNGFSSEEEHITLRLGPILGDAPAKAYIKGIIQFNGYNGCDYCVQPGVREDGRMTFPECNAEERTDLEWRTTGYPDHQNACSPLEKVESVDMIYHFPHDPLHHLDLGVMKRLLQMFFVEKKGIHRLPAWAFREVSRRMKSKENEREADQAIYPKDCFYYTPMEFGRPPRGLEEMAHYKGIEYKHILLYYGPYLFKNVLVEEYYNHFLLLHAAVTVYYSEAHKKFWEKAHEWLVKYVKKGKQLYEPSYIVYNTHNLVHVYKDVCHWGTLNNLTAYPFESFLGRLKTFVKKPYQEMSQVVKRVYALVDNKMPFTKTKERKGIKLTGLEPNVFQEGKCFSRLTTPDIILDTRKPGNNIIMSSIGKVYKVTRIVERQGLVHLLCNEYTNPIDVYSTPIRSSLLNIYNVSDIKNETAWIGIDDVKIKFCVVPSVSDNTLSLFPLLHAMT